MQNKSLMVVEVAPVYLWCKKRETATIDVYTVNDFWNVIIFVIVGGEKYILSVSHLHHCHCKI